MAETSETEATFNRIQKALERAEKRVRKSAGRTGQITVNAIMADLAAHNELQWLGDELEATVATFIEE